MSGSRSALRMGSGRAITNAKINQRKSPAKHGEMHAYYIKVQAHVLSRRCG